MVTITRVKYNKGKAVSVTKKKTSTSFSDYKKKSSSSKKAEIESAVGKLSSEPEKKTVVVGVSKDETTGQTTATNIGKDLTSSQRKEISSYTSQYGRLTSTVDPVTKAVTFTKTSTVQDQVAGVAPTAPATTPTIGTTTLLLLGGGGVNTTTLLLLGI